MDSSQIGKPSLAHRGHRLIYLAVTQTLVIVWLALWNIGDYLNNIYVHAYVDGMLATYGWLIVLAFVGGSLGSSWMFVHRRHRITGKSVEVAVKESRPPKITPTVLKTAALSAPSTGLNPKLASIGIRTSTFSTPQSTSAPTNVPQPTVTPTSFTPSPPSSEASAKPSVELHPAVAALKAEMSERRVSLGLVSATVGQETARPPGQVQQPQPMERPASNFLEARPQQRSEQPMNPQQLPPTVVRPSLPPGPVQRPVQPPPGIRPMQPFGFGRPSQPGQNNPASPQFQRPPQPGSADRFEDAVSRAGFIPTNNQPPAAQGPSPAPRAPPPFEPPHNVTTVITGIMPGQKKKDPADPNDQNANTGQ